MTHGKEWDRFVDASADATFFHRAAWKDVLEHSFGFASHFLMARRAERVVGVLPLCELRPPLGRPRLLSLPFAVEAGISAADQAARQALEQAALGIAQDIGARYLELRDGLDSGSFASHGDAYCRFRRTLFASDEQNFEQIPRKQRRMIRVAQRNHLSARVENDLAIFFPLYAHGQRRLGTPLLPRHYFAQLQQQFGAACEILVVRHDATPVAAVLSFFFRDTVLPYYAGARRDCFSLGVNDFMYWELMRLACQRGLRVFDFGRSRRGSGSFDYKRHWGFEPQALHYRVHSLGHPAAQRRTVDAPSLRLLRWGWRRVPLPLTMKLGPALARRFAPYFT
jgi:FemAB-related protein (PEP-CTERM system-associated)